jgi:hypothetical protein
MIAGQSTTEVPMNALRHLRRNAVAYVALIAAIGTGAAYAADKITSRQIAKNAIKAKHIKNGQVGTADVADGGLRAIDFAGGELPRGEQGPAGPAGPQGEAATKLWATVNPDGTLADGEGVVSSVSNADTNFYLVKWDRDVSGCAMIANVGGHPDFNFAAQGIATVNTLPVTNPEDEGLTQVSTFSLSGANAQRAFHVAVLC